MDSKIVCLLFVCFLSIAFAQDEEGPRDEGPEEEGPSDGSFPECRCEEGGRGRSREGERGRGKKRRFLFMGPFPACDEMNKKMFEYMKQNDMRQNCSGKEWPEMRACWANNMKEARINSGAEYSEECWQQMASVYGPTD